MTDNKEKLKELIGTKFLFNDNLISYESLVKLLCDSGLCVDFIQKPIKDKLEVHSLYIKPDFEVTFLANSNEADEYYKNAGYSCVDYKEITIQEVLNGLGYIPEIKEQKEKKYKKHKYIIIIDINKDREYVVKMKHILYLSYAHRELYICFKNTCIERFSISEEKYLEIKEMLKT